MEKSDLQESQRQQHPYTGKLEGSEFSHSSTASSVNSGVGLLTSVVRFCRSVRGSWDSSSEDEAGEKDHRVNDSGLRGLRDCAMEGRRITTSEAQPKDIQRRQGCEKKDDSSKNKKWVENKVGPAHKLVRKKLLGMETMRESVLLAPDKLGRNDFVIALTRFIQGEIALYQLLDVMFFLKQQLSLRISMHLFNALNTPGNLKMLVACLVDTTVVENRPDDCLRTYRYPFVARHVLADGSQAIRLSLLKSKSSSDQYADDSENDEGALVNIMLDYLESGTLCELVCSHIIAVLISLLREDRRKMILIMSKRPSFLPALVKKIRYSCVPDVIVALVADVFDGELEVVETMKNSNGNMRGSNGLLANLGMKCLVKDSGYGMLFPPAVRYLVDSDILGLLCDKFCEAVGATAISALPTKGSHDKLPRGEMPPESSFSSPSRGIKEKGPSWYRDMQQAQNSLSTIMTLARAVSSLSSSLPKILKKILSTVIQAYLQLDALLTEPSCTVNPLNSYLLLSLTLTLQLLSPPVSVPTYNVIPFLRVLITILIDVTPTPSPSPVLRLSILNTLSRVQYWSLSVVVNRDYSQRKQLGKALESVRLSEVLWKVGKKCGESEEIQRVVRKAASEGFGGSLGDEGWKLWIGDGGKLGRRVLNEWEKSISGGRTFEQEWKRTVVEVGGWIVNEGGSRVERDLGDVCGARLRKLVAKEQEIRGQNFWKANEIKASPESGSLRKSLKAKSPLLPRSRADLDTERPKSSLGRRKIISESKLKSLFDAPT